MLNLTEGLLPPLLRLLLLLLLLPSNCMSQDVVGVGVGVAVGVEVNRDPAAASGGIPEGSIGNPLNRYCGISYEEAQRFCHLPVHQSLPCPNGDIDCAYDLPCWTLDTPCTLPPSPGPTSMPSRAVTESPTVVPSTMPSAGVSPSPSISGSPTPLPTTEAPITKISSNAGDHNFCGLGFDNLFDCAVNCPNGSPNECPEGQLCYFNTPCDARLMSKENEEAEAEDKEDPGAEATEDGEGEANVDVVKEEEEEEANNVQTEDEVAASDPVNNQKFCGANVTDASDNCHRDRHCPMGHECPADEYCFVVNCSMDDFPTIAPTPIPPPTTSPKPTDEATTAPVLPDPDASDTPTMAELDPDDIRNFFWCGVDWGDASERCYLPCIDGFHSSCPKGEECFANVSCKGKKNDDNNDEEEEGDGETASVERTPSPDGSTWSPTVSLPPTLSPPPSSEEDKGSENGEDEDGDVDAEGGEVNDDDDENNDDDEKENEKEAARTPSPDGSTWSPTITPPPMVIANETIMPTINETTLPTASPILADDYRNFFYCGTNWTDASTRCHKWCKSGFHTECDDDEECFAQADCQGEVKPETHMPTISPVPTTNPASTVTPTTEVPSVEPPIVMTVGPTRMPETSSVMSLDMSMSSSLGPTMSIILSMSTSIPTVIPLRFDTDTEVPTVVSVSPTVAVDVDAMEFAPDDPAGYFFCGTDWNHAITDCPHRCPTGEAFQCPEGMFCYAFTPCVGIGGMAKGVEGMKPTYEPTPSPVSSEPTTTEQYWDAQNSPAPVVSWTESPATYAPTGDRCRGQPCNLMGECRSEVGFCGEGIVFCNSKSTWVSICGGVGTQIQLEAEEDEVSNGEPTAAPLTLWESWVAERDATASDAATDEEVDGLYEGNSNETSQDNQTVIPIADSWDNWVVSDNWNNGQNSAMEWNVLHHHGYILIGVAIVARILI